MTNRARSSTRRDPGRAVLLGVLLLAACSGGRGAPPAAPTPAAGPRVALPSGAVFSLELARTPEEIAQGLMFRESLAPSSGMVFLFDAPEPRSFWMKNCHFPLDMVFALADGTVVDVLENVPPCEADPCPSYPARAPADTVVELAGGEAGRHGVVPGARLSFLSVPGR
ncbi:MAG TPA: DUF192 domain-containing protein [Thermoanaerobaculia bacterium]|jgi:uncharacterized membrane protein (UPF0127 family)|nr:DUF192 domain-containing protein [Thermoanaerobaculia bacterium]HPA50969.1 DUF192 domain-containing protein [Thermoanaerobaculia bacterium]HQN07677.1 DUF192 domain-containing protein [Thermoanaerobaculia bacterium]HQP84775.1 DUF192 domain-containing protein [Thermoanaerobaculia bacterium]